MYVRYDANIFEFHLQLVNRKRDVDALNIVIIFSLHVIVDSPLKPSEPRRRAKGDDIREHTLNKESQILYILYIIYNSRRTTS